jgi:hypothetical protein
MDCYRAHKASEMAGRASSDEDHLAQCTDTHQTCRGCGIDLYRVVDWVAEAKRCNRKWFCSAGCFDAWHDRTF